LRTYLTAGSPAELIERFTALTGRAELPPRWALGFHQCRYGYASEAEVRTIIAGFEQHRLPLDVFHQDIDYMDGFRVFTVDKSRYPDFPGLAAELHSKGIRLVTIIDPGVKADPQWDAYTNGLAKNVFVREPQGGRPVRGLVWPDWCVFPDFTSPAARQWWGSLYPRLLDQGVDGIWHDMNEPAAFAAWGDPSLPRAAAHDMDGRGGTHAEAHNLYGLLMNKAGHAALKKHRPDRRPWLLTRSGWAGVQRYAWHWTGDTESTWDALRMTIPQVLNAGLSGVPYCGPDIGGFSGNPDAELYTRWFQLAALLPFFRNHAGKTTNPREPWVYGEPYTSIIRSAMRLRRRLMPYLYTLAWEASRTGAPLARPLFWLEPGNPDLWDVDDCFLLGSDLLVAPVLEPQARTRRFHLPAGRWHYFWADYCIEDTMHFETPVSLQRIPIYVRGGSILPAEEQDELILHVYPDGSGRAAGQVYSDPGDGYGSWRVDSFQVETHPGEVVVSRASRGDYPPPWTGIRAEVHGNVLPVRIITL
jgi:alpha-glucosidase